MLRLTVFFFLFAGVASQTCASICASGVCHDSLCVCSSGAYTDLAATNGLECQLHAPNTCANANLSALITENYPTLDTANSKMQSNILRVVVYSPLVNNRLATRVYFGEYNNATAYRECSFPGPYWVKSIDTTGNCREVYTADIPWATAALCGWSVDNSQSGYVNYKNYIFVRHDDQLSSFRGVPVMRDTIHAFPIQIRFQTAVEVSTNLNIFAPVNLLAAVTLQTYDPAVSQGSINILTSLQWPFYLQSVNLGNIPVTLTAVAAGTDVDCVNNTGNACTQLYSITVNPHDACTLSGGYQLNFVIGCRGDPSQCPLDSNTNTAVVSASINSENFCNGVQIDIGLTGTLAVYQDSAFSTPKSNFLHAQTAHFRASLSTDGSASIVSSTIEQVRISDGTNTRFLLDQNITADGSSVNFALINGQPAANPAFSFVPNEQVMPVPVDQQLSYTVYAAIRVGYAGGVQRRMIVARQVAPSAVSGEYSVSILMENPSVPPSPSPSVQPEPASVESTTWSWSTSTVEDMAGSSTVLAVSALLLGL
jgi:hypothetical protein